MNPEGYKPAGVNEDIDARGPFHDNSSEYDENFLFVQGGLKDVERKITYYKSQLENADNIDPEERKVLEASLALAQQRKDELERQMRVEMKKDSDNLREAI